MARLNIGGLLRTDGSVVVSSCYLTLISSTGGELGAFPEAHVTGSVYAVRLTAGNVDPRELQSSPLLCALAIYSPAGNLDPGEVIGCSCCLALLHSLSGGELGALAEAHVTGTVPGDCSLSWDCDPRQLQSLPHRSRVLGGHRRS